MSGYGSMPTNPDSAGVTGRADWDARVKRSQMETLESADEGMTIKIYLAIGTVLSIVATYALYTLWGNVSSDLGNLATTAGEDIHGGKLLSDGGAGGGGSHRRLMLKHLLQQPAADQAQRYTWDQIETWGKKHPTEPIHNGMVKILEKEPARFKQLVTTRVINSLTSLETCDKSHVCKPNHLAAFIRSHTCPANKPCSKETKQEIHRLATWASRIAVDGAFQGILQQMAHKAAPPPSTFRGHTSSHNGPSTTGGESPSAGGYRVPGMGMPLGKVSREAYSQAAESGMGYQPGGYQPAPPKPMAIKPS